MHDYSFLFGACAPDHIQKAANHIIFSDNKKTMIELPPRSGKTSLALSYIAAMMVSDKSILHINLLPVHALPVPMWNGKSMKNLTVIKILDDIDGNDFDMVLVDDPIRNMFQSRDVKEISKMVSWWETSVVPSLSETGRQIVIGTRWGQNDFMGQIKDGFDVLTIPALDRYGRSYWPDMFPVSQLKEIQQSAGDYAFDWLYQQGSPVYETRAVAISKDDV